MPRKNKNTTQLLGATQKKDNQHKPRSSSSQWCVAALKTTTWTAAVVIQKFFVKLRLFTIARYSLCTLLQERLLLKPHIYNLLFFFLVSSNFWARFGSEIDLPAGSLPGSNFSETLVVLSRPASGFSIGDVRTSLRSSWVEQAVLVFTVVMSSPAGKTEGRALYLDD